MADLYRTLGVDRSADSDTIRKTFKKLARKFHPDINKDPKAEDRFKEINAAYDVLGDEKKRAMYDQYGEASTRAGFDPRHAGWGGAGRAGGFPGFSGGVEVDDLLGSIFGAGMGGGPRRGANQRLRLEVPFLSVVTGESRKVTYSRPDGTRQSLEVAIPAGAKNGGKIRLRGQGLPPRGGGPCGDLIVELTVLPHPFLKRTGDHLEMNLPLTILEMLKGTSVEVPTPTGTIKVTIPKNSKANSRMRIKGRGVQRKSVPGDLYLRLSPVLPEQVDAGILAAAEALESGYLQSPRANLKL